MYMQYIWFQAAFSCIARIRHRFTTYLSPRPSKFTDGNDGLDVGLSRIITHSIEILTDIGIVRPDSACESAEMIRRFDSLAEPRHEQIGDPLSNDQLSNQASMKRG